MMAEVTFTDLYRVTVVEYEAGWGQRIDPNDTKLFTTREEAEAYKRRWEEGGSPGCYWRADIEKIG
jgi:hypothetical protein